LLIDRDHQIDYAVPGTPVKAAGWIKEMQVREDGIWGRVEWTERALAEIKAKEYRYISPVFMHKKDTGEITAIIRASLTNHPNLELKAVASSQTKNTPSSHSHKEKDTMNKTLLALADGPYLELFSRSNRPGWDAWGNETGKFGEVA
tara:strand:+ start:381 stop:821 length:441 start_codon:yes stop_codon:yes gene_type:complete